MHEGNIVEGKKKRVVYDPYHWVQNKEDAHLEEMMLEELRFTRLMLIKYDSLEK